MAAPMMTPSNSMMHLNAILLTPHISTPASNFVVAQSTTSYSIVLPRSSREQGREQGRITVQRKRSLSPIEAEMAKRYIRQADVDAMRSTEFILDSIWDRALDEHDEESTTKVHKMRKYECEYNVDATIVPGGSIVPKDGEREEKRIDLPTFSDVVDEVMRLEERDKCNAADGMMMFMDNVFNV